MWELRFSSVTGSLKYAIADTKFYVPVMTLSTRNSIKLLKQIELGF